METGRAVEQTNFAMVKADLGQGILAVQNARDILRDHHGASVALQSAAPEVYLSSGGAGSSMSTVGMLEATESVLSKNMAELFPLQKQVRGWLSEDSQEIKLNEVSKKRDVKYKEHKQSAGELISLSKSSNAELPALMFHLAKLNARSSSVYVERNDFHA